MSSVMASLRVVFAVAAVLACSGEAVGEGSVADPVDVVQEFCTRYLLPCGNSNSRRVAWDDPSLRELRDRGVDIIPILIELVKRQDHSYVLRYPSPALEAFGWTPEENWGTPAQMREHCCRNAMQALGSSADDRAMLFLIEEVRNEFEGQLLRGDALQALWPWVERKPVRDLLVEVLSDVDRWSWERAPVRRALMTCRLIVGNMRRGPWTALVVAYRLRIEDKKRRLARGEKINADMLADDEVQVGRLALLSMDTPAQEEENVRPRSEGREVVPPAAARTGDAESSRKLNPRPANSTSRGTLWAALSLLLLAVMVGVGALRRVRRR